LRSFVIHLFFMFFHNLSMLLHQLISFDVSLSSHFILLPIELLDQVSLKFDGLFGNRYLFFQTVLIFFILSVSLIILLSQLINSILKFLLDLFHLMMSLLLLTFSLSFTVFFDLLWILKLSLKIIDVETQGLSFSLVLSYGIWTVCP